LLPERLKEGGPIVETEENGDSKNTKEKGFFLSWFVVLDVPVQEIFVVPWASLVGPVQNVVFLTLHCFNLFLAGRAVVLGRLSLCMRLCPPYRI
jgi:hypothetical protein